MKFYKFDGAGNDFVLVDNRDASFHLDEKQIATLCHRRFGIGADGLMLLNAPSGEEDFQMVYYNSDGRLGTMCGNGGRCIAVFAMHLGLGHSLSFLGSDGLHHAEVSEWNPFSGRGLVRLSMQDVDRRSVRPVLDGFFLDTGSPHFVRFVEDLEHLDVYREGRSLRLREDLFPGGTNVDFLCRRADGSIDIRTFERGVEDETWACGTGVTAAALVSGVHQVHARGGDFEVEFSSLPSLFSNIILSGPVSLNFEGEWPLN